MSRLGSQPAEDESLVRRVSRQIGDRALLQLADLTEHFEVLAGNVPYCFQQLIPRRRRALRRRPETDSGSASLAQCAQRRSRSIFMRYRFRIRAANSGGTKRQMKLYGTLRFFRNTAPRSSETFIA